MVLFNYATKELTAKVVYYGPGLCGKTTNLQWIHEHLPIKNKGKMLSLATETDRTLFFDFLPIDLGNVRGMKMRIQLYTVPGQVFYNATRRMVLKGADAIVFVVDSQEAMFDAGLESFENMRQNLEANEINPDELPTVFQYNKRDLANALPIEILNERLNPRGLPFAEAVAIKGAGVEDTLKLVTRVVFATLSQRYGDGASAPLSPPSPLGPGSSNPPGTGVKPAPRAAAPLPLPPATRTVTPVAASTKRPAAALSTLPPENVSSLRRVERSDEIYESLDLSPLDDQLPDLEIEEEDTSPALHPRTVPLPPAPAGSRETLSVAPDKAAEIRRMIASGRPLEEELSVELGVDGGGSTSAADGLRVGAALEDFDGLFTSTGHPTLTPDASIPPGSPPPPVEVTVETSMVPEPRSALTTPAATARPGATGAGEIITAQAQVSVPVEVQVPPGCNRINLSLQLVIKLREKR